jgi:hypothetical protein
MRDKSKIKKRVKLHLKKKVPPEGGDNPFCFGCFLHILLQCVSLRRWIRPAYYSKILVFIVFTFNGVYSLFIQSALSLIYCLTHPLHHCMIAPLANVETFVGVLPAHRTLCIIALRLDTALCVPCAKQWTA